MKKTIFIILAILPIFLVISIAFAGRILALYQHISVEKVTFVDEEKNEYEEDFMFKVNVGESKQTYIIVYPELASNKSVTYYSKNPDKCTVDDKGVVTGVSFGTSIITVKTDDGSKIAMLDVSVTEDYVTSVALPHEEIELMVGFTETLTAIIMPSAAVNKNVTYSTSNDSVAIVDVNGIVKGINPGEAIITATTEDGGFTAECKVTVVMGIPAIKFDFSSSEEIIQSGVGYITTVDEIKLLDYLFFDESRIDVNDIKFKIISGGENVTLNADTLTFKKKGVVHIIAYVGDENSPTHQTSILSLMKN